MTTSDRPKRALIRRDLCERYKKSAKTIKRWKDSGILPPPDFVINNIEHWWETTIEQNEQRLRPSPLTGTDAARAFRKSPGASRDQRRVKQQVG